MSTIATSVRNEPIRLEAKIGPYRYVTYLGVLPAAGAGAAGPTRYGGDVGDLVGVPTIGSGTVEIAAAVRKGYELEATADGRAQEHAGSNVVTGIALEDGAAAGDKIEALTISRGA